MSHGSDRAAPACWVISFDGAAIPRTGRMAIGVHATAPDGRVHTISRALAHAGDGNEAEAHALVAALELARSLAVHTLELRSDSDVVVAHVHAKKRTTVARIATPLDHAVALLASFADARLVLVTRAKNGDADALARAALGLKDRAHAR
jgi:ribonuclease HI